MKALINTTIRSMLIFSLPIILVASALLGFNIGYEPNTETVENNYHAEFVMEDEAYIDDIPFDTEQIAQHILFDKSQNETFSFDDEAYIDDIPFNTRQIAVDQNNSYASMN